MLNPLQLIYRDDLLIARLIPSSLDEARVKTCIIEAQHFDVRPLLGDAFYFAILDGVESYSDEYDELLNGIEYNDAGGNPVKFYGLKMCLAYYAAARLMSRNDKSIASHGLIKKLNPHSTPLDAEETSAEISALRSGAVTYWHDTKKFLNQRIDDFPLWKKFCSNDAPAGAIKIRAVG